MISVKRLLGLIGLIVLLVGSSGVPGLGKDAEPRTAAAYAHRGDARSSHGDYDGAISDYTKSLKLDPRNAETYYARGIARDHKSDDKGAIEDYSNAVKLD